MSFKTIISTVLLLFVAVSVGYLVVSETRTAPQATTPAEDAVARPSDAVMDETAAHKVIAYYFHNTQRCPTCLKIERLAADALKAEFAELLESGNVEWRVLNMEEPPNEHFVTDYELVTSSLVIVDVHDGQPIDWMNMKRVWELAHDEVAFTQYVTDQIRAYLEF